MPSPGASPPLDRRKALEAALAASQAATDVLLTRFRPTEGDALDMWMKSAGALVTDADIAADRAIAAALERAGAPGDILSEESSAARGGGRLTWLIDPLCGTVPFSTGMGHWGVNIALRHDHLLEVAILALPTLGEQLSAVRGHGVSRNGRPWAPRPMTGRIGDLAVGLEIDGGEEWRRLLGRGLDWVPRVGQVNTFASAAYPLGQVVLGRLAAAVFYGIAPVHLAAGSAIALELGLEVTDAAGEPLAWGANEDFPVAIVAWPEIRRQLTAAMSTGPTPIR